MTKLGKVKRLGLTCHHLRQHHYKILAGRLIEICTAKRITFTKPSPDKSIYKNFGVTCININDILRNNKGLEPSSLTADPWGTFTAPASSRLSTDAKVRSQDDECNKTALADPLYLVLMLLAVHHQRKIDSMYLVYRPWLIFILR